MPSCLRLSNLLLKPSTACCEELYKVFWLFLLVLKDLNSLVVIAASLWGRQRTRKWFEPQVLWLVYLLLFFRLGLGHWCVNGVKKKKKSLISFPCSLIFSCLPVLFRWLWTKFWKCFSKDSTVVASGLMVSGHNGVSHTGLFVKNIMSMDAGN